MFGEMMGVWLMMALNKYQIDGEEETVIPKQLKTINLVEIGPGTGLMMSDILRTLNQFSGNLKNV